MKYPCYTTKTGIKIGGMYVPQQRNNMSIEDEFWQGHLIKRSYSVRQIGITKEIAEAVMFVMFIFALFIMSFVFEFTQH